MSSEDLKKDANSENNKDPIQELNKKIEDINLKLISQEHRLLNSLKNLFEAYSGKKPAKQKQAAVLAFGRILWSMRTRAILVATIGGIVGTVIALFTLLEFRRQNSALFEQNQLFREQNQQVLVQSRQEVVSTNGQMVSDLIGDLFAARSEANIHADSSWTIPDPLIFRIISVSNALEPYDSILISFSPVKDSTIFISRERGELLQALAAMNVDFPLSPDPNFSNADLRGANLRGADLEGADLSGANLFGAYLIGAYLFGADLSRADLSGAHLRRADFEGADLRRANLVGADLEGADLSLTDLSGANLRGAYLFGVDFFKANLVGAHLSDADLSKVDLSQINSLYKTIGIPDSIKLKLPPKLFEKPEEFPYFFIPN